MCGKIYEYIRVSTKEQNEARQVVAMREFGVPEENLFLDKQSGKDFHRPAYRRLLRKLRAEDTLVVKSIDQLGRNYDEIIDQWRTITKTKKATIMVLDLPLLNQLQACDSIGRLIANLVLDIMSYFAEADGTVEKIQIVAPDGSESEISADEISIFGKQVTVIGDPGDGSHREKPAAAPPVKDVPMIEPEPMPVSSVGETAAEPEFAPVPSDTETAPNPAPVPESAPETAPEPSVAPQPEEERPTPTQKKAPATRAKKTAKAASAQEEAPADSKAMERHRRFLIGKKATRDILAGGGAIITKAGEEITEATLQKAQLAGKLIELSMNAQ